MVEEDIYGSGGTSAGKYDNNPVVCMYKCIYVCIYIWKEGREVGREEEKEGSEGSEGRK